MKTRFTLMLVIAFLMKAENTIADPMESPVVPHITIRSEIVRGKDEGQKCAIENMFDLDAAKSCINDLEMNNRRVLGDGFLPYDTGLYFSAWIQARITVNIASGGNSENSIESAQIEEEYYWKTYTSARRRLGGITDEAVVIAISAGGPIYDYISDAIKRWGD